MFLTVLGGSPTDIFIQATVVAEHIFGLDLADPQTVDSLLGGALAFVIVLVLGRLLQQAMNHSRGNDRVHDKHEGDMLALFRIMLTDLQKSLDRSTDVASRGAEALEGNTRALNALLDATNRFEQRLASLETRVTALSPSPTPSEVPFDDVWLT